MLLAAWLGGSCEHACLAQIKLATDRPQPHSPEDSVRMIRVPKGLRVEVAASEPLLADPTDMAFDAQGRIFVCELHGYNLEGYYDILELNKTGVLDTKVYRVDASREAQERAAKDQYGTVKMLEDTDGDGRFDKATVWADRLPRCYGVAPALDGVVVACPPDLIYLGDADGDGQAGDPEEAGPDGRRPDVGPAELPRGGTSTTGTTATADFVSGPMAAPSNPPPAPASSARRPPIGATASTSCRSSRSATWSPCRTTTWPATRTTGRRPTRRACCPTTMCTRSASPTRGARSGARTRPG